MDIYKVKWTTLQEEIFRLLCLKAGKKLSQREIAKILGVSPTAVANSLTKIKDENVIKIEKNRSMNLVSFNRDERKAIELKRVENLRNIYSSGLAHYLEEIFHGRAIILFGSYSRGEDTTTSDIDIAIIGTKGKNIELDRFEKILEREIIINYYKSLKEIHPDLKLNILSGILLAGVIEL